MSTYGHLDNVVMIGFGSIGRGTLPLILRHFDIEPERITVLAPNDDNDTVLKEAGVTRVDAFLTHDNYAEVLEPLLTPGTFVVNLSVDTSSVEILRLARERGALYIDTVIEPWAGLYDDPDLPMSERTNHALRQTLLAERRERPGGVTAVSACGANPGMVSWFAKQALLDVADAIGLPYSRPSTRAQWAALMRDAGAEHLVAGQGYLMLYRSERELHGFFEVADEREIELARTQPVDLLAGGHVVQFELHLRV